MSFIDELTAAIMPLYQRFFTTRIWKDLASSEKADIELWKIFLRETYHYTKHNGVNQALCVMRTATTEKQLLRRYLKHAMEELDHDFLALNDLEKLGIDRASVIKSRPLPETQAFSSMIYDLVIRENPIGRLGYSFWAESANRDLGVIATRLRYHFDLPDNHMSFIVAHQGLDQGHHAMVIRAIEIGAKTDEDREAIMYFGTATCRMYYRWLEALYDHYEEQRAARRAA